MSVTPIDCPVCVWTQVIASEKQGRIRVITTNPAQYFYIVQQAGEAVPDNEDAGTRLDAEEWNFQYREAVDIYFLTKQYDGKVLYDNDEPFTDVFLQDQITDPILINFNQVHDSTTLNGAIALNDRNIIVTDATGIVIGSYLILFDPGSVRFSTFTVIGIVGTTITLDSPTDFAYPDGTFVDIAIIDMSVDGSVTPEVFGLRGIGTPPGVELTMDVTRFIFEMTTSSAVSLELFGNITALLRGLLVRSRNGRVKNIFNVKSNGEIAGIMFDWTPFAASNPVQGIDGFVSRFTITKLGVATRLKIGEDLEAWVQDNLLSITSFKMIAEGHIVD